MWIVPETCKQKNKNKNKNLTSHKLLSRELLKLNLVEYAFMLATQMWPHKALLHTDVGQIRDLATFSCGGFRVGKKKN